MKYLHILVVLKPCPFYFTEEKLLAYNSIFALQPQMVCSWKTMQ